MCGSCFQTRERAPQRRDKTQEPLNIKIRTTSFDRLKNMAVSFEPSRQSYQGLETRFLRKKTRWALFDDEISVFSLNSG